MLKIFKFKDAFNEDIAINRPWQKLILQPHS